jgi:hypothetical protein
MLIFKFKAKKMVQSKTLDHLNAGIWSTDHRHLSQIGF